MAKDFNEVLKQGGNKAVQAEINEMLEGVDDEFEQAENKVEKAKAEKEDAKKAAQEKAAAEKKLENAMFYLPFSDVGNADRLFAMYGNEIRYNTETGYWGFFKNGVWNFESDKNSALYPQCRKISDYIEQHAPKYTITTNSNGSISLDESKKQPNTPEQVNFGKKLIKEWQKKKIWANAIEVLKGTEEILITQKDLNTHKNLLNVKNGVLDLETGILYPAAPELLFTLQANVIFNPRATCPTFDKFLLDILPDDNTRAAVLRYLGYCLTGCVNEEKILFVQGKGGNGKGTLFETICYLLGSYATEFDIEMLLRQRYPKDANTASPEIAKLQYKHLAYCPETPAGREFDAAKLKALTGGDTIPARQLYGKPFEYLPMFKLIVSGQHFPNFENPHEVGFGRRFLPVVFDQIFANNPDTHLKDKLRAPAELSGVLNRLSAESKEWYKATATGKSGLIVSNAMIQTKQDYISDNDFIANFISDFCELNPDSSVSRKDFLARLKAEYPQARRFRDSELIDSVCKIDGVFYKQIGRNKINSLIGLKLLD